MGIKRGFEEDTAGHKGDTAGNTKGKQGYSRNTVQTYYRNSSDTYSLGTVEVRHRNTAGIQ